jgi:hypothetical protein
MLVSSLMTSYKIFYIYDRYPFGNQIVFNDDSEERVIRVEFWTLFLTLKNNE